MSDNILDTNSITWTDVSYNDTISVFYDKIIHNQMYSSDTYRNKGYRSNNEKIMIETNTPLQPIDDASYVSIDIYQTLGRF